MASTLKRFMKSINGELLIQDIGVGTSFSMALSTTGELYVTGQNGSGQLALGDSNPRSEWTKCTTVPTESPIKQLMCSDNNTLILLDDNTLWGTGYNVFGELGVGDTILRDSFTQVTNLPSGNIKQVACGNSHSLILLDDNTLWGCGQNSQGQLGLGNMTGDSTFIQITDLPSGTIKEVVCGNYHSYILMENGSLYSTGFNNTGQLGLGDTTNRTTFTQVTNLPSGNIKQIKAGNNHSFILMENNMLCSTGNAGNGALGLGDIVTSKVNFIKVTNRPNGTIKEVVCCSAKSCILMEDKSLYVTGNNSYGALGLGDTTNRTTFTQVTSIPPDREVIKISFGNSHTLVLLDDGSIWGSGNNNNMQLGIPENFCYTFTQIHLPI